MPGRLPFGEATQQPADLPAVGSEKLDGAIGIGTVIATAICDVFLAFWETPQALLQLINRNRDGARDVAGIVFDRRSSIENHDLARSDALDEFVNSDRL